MEPQEGPEEPGRGRQQRWEAQWQHFLQALQAPPPSAWGSPQGSEAAPWEDAKAFLASFEQVAAACRWPRGEWVARLRPALSGDAQQAFGLLAAGEQEDYGQVKAAILRGEALRREAQRQHFRQFCFPPELGEPRRLYSRLQELCCRWLRPERHTKEQILELLVLEQLLASLPGEVQSWVRAGGPDSCAQAVALLEELLASRREADTGTWQDPVQEWALGPLDIKEEPKGQAERFRGTQQNVDGEVAVPGTGFTRDLLLPPEGQDVAEAELTKALGAQVEQEVHQRETEVPLHVVEWTLMQPSQQPTFWNVLQEDGENVVSLEGTISPQLGPHPVKKEEFLPDPVQSPRLPSQESDDGKGTQLKVKNSQFGGNEPVGTPRRGQGRNEENVPVSAEIQEEGHESNSRQGMEPFRECKESADLTEGLGAACSNPSPVDTEKASFSKYGRRYRSKTGLVFEPSGEDDRESPPLGEKIHLKSKLDKRRVRHVEEKIYGNTRTGEKLHKCHLCGESFTRRPDLSRHQKTHTGAKPHRYLNCGKSFSTKSDLLKHDVIQAGKKQRQCSEYGNNFCQRSRQKTHTGEKRHKCPNCGQCFSQRSNLLRHQMIHTGKKPPQCPECGKNFTRKSTVLRHQAIHTGEKPHQCPECGKSFAQRSHLLRHQMIHTREKPPK